MRITLPPRATAMGVGDAWRTICPLESRNVKPPVTWVVASPLALLMPNTSYEQ